MSNHFKIAQITSEPEFELAADTAVPNTQFRVESLPPESKSYPADPAQGLAAPAPYPYYPQPQTEVLKPGAIIVFLAVVIGLILAIFFLDRKTTHGGKPAEGPLPEIRSSRYRVLGLGLLSAVLVFGFSWLFTLLTKMLNSNSYWPAMQFYLIAATFLGYALSVFGPAVYYARARGGQYSLPILICELLWFGLVITVLLPLQID